MSSVSNLHAFQLDVVERTAAAFVAGHKAVVLQMGTGSGKTHTAAEILRRSIAIRPGRRALFLADLDAILEDTVGRLRAAGLHVGLHQADRESDPTAPIQVASLQTLHARRGKQEYPPANLIVADECHNVCAATVRETLSVYPDARLLGLTATPTRGDGQSLGDVFTEIVSGPSNEWLVKHGYLVPCELVAPFEESKALSCDPLEAYQRWTPGRRAIVFVPSVKFAGELADRFTQTGVPAECITGKTPRKTRSSVRQRVIDGETLVITGVDLFVRAFDLPPLDTVILARPFSTLGPWLQAMGRGSRVYPGKQVCTAIDLCGSWLGLGLRDDPRTWTLTGNAVAPGQRLPPIQRCRQCAAVFPPRSACPRCGATATTAQRVVRVLSRADKLAMVSRLPQAEQDKRYMASLEKVAMQRGKLDPATARSWALKKFKAKRGRDPVTT